jgi:hypothetical protein
MLIRLLGAKVTGLMLLLMVPGCGRWLLSWFITFGDGVGSLFGSVGSGSPSATLTSTAKKNNNDQGCIVVAARAMIGTTPMIQARFLFVAKK